MQAEQPLTVPLLLDALVSDKRLDARHVAQCLSAIQSSTTAPAAHPLVAVAEQSLPDQQRTGNCLTIEVLLHWLAQRYDQRVFTIDPLVIDVSAVTAVMSAQFAKRHRILAVQVSDNEVVIAHCEPLVSDWEKHLQSVLCHPIRRVLASPVELDRFITEFYHLATSVHGAIAHHPNQAASIANLEQMVELGKLETPDANDQPIIRIVDGLLNYAFAQRASDIHIEPRRAATYIRFRIDGALHTVYQLPVPVGIAVVSRLKILGRLNVAEKRRPQDGRLKTKTSPDHGAPGHEIELRLATLPTAFGEKIVLRIFDPEVLLRRFEQLGLEGEDYQRWQSMIERSHGIVLVTGPTGSGKTTTLYSSLKHLAVPTVNVCTIEDPIEMMEDSFNQMQVQHSIGLDFASGVRALMRQDPDIIMIGEIRDLETAEMAIQAALTGHLVLSTLHTNDAPAAITRLLELGVRPYLLRATLIGVMAQRLVRTLCEQCKQPIELDQHAWQQLANCQSAPDTIYQASGCTHCRHTGYYGRRGIYEILPLSPAIQALIDEQTELGAIRKCGVQEGMRPLRLAGAGHVAAGYTTIDEVLRVAPV